MPDKTEDLVLSVTWFFSTWGATLSENADTLYIVFYVIAEKSPMCTFLLLWGKNHYDSLLVCPSQTVKRAIVTKLL